ncbi:hypothetical protein T459_12706 [Capsicum annuum]|uniref:Ubiquitin-like protease family profile domain-containing protein n=1 Tax=Capsicum annuum TaxID=4072 RepID=A0A2G2ZQJ5_CAPAN|nr:hypothetical protein T459_12706 [Capsicum annuum]
MKLFGATTITRKIILEGGLVVVDDGSSSGSNAAVGANDAPLTVFETTSHYDYDHTVIQILPLLANVLHTNCLACGQSNHTEDMCAFTIQVNKLMKRILENQEQLWAKLNELPFSPCLQWLNKEEHEGDISQFEEKTQESQPLDCHLDLETGFKKAKRDGVINAINALTASVKEMTSKRGVIPLKRISYSYAPLEIKMAKRRRKDISRASSIIEKRKIVTPLSLSCIAVQCTRATGKQHELKKVDVTVEVTAEKHNIIVDNPSTASKKEEKVKPVSSEELKNYLFKGFNITDEALKQTNKVDQRLFIMDCPWAVKTSRLQEFLINIIKDFSILAGLPWHLVDEMYIPINCGDEFHWVLAVVVLKERHIRVYDSMSRRRHSGPSSEIQKLVKILPTYLDMSGFLD